MTWFSGAFSVHTQGSTTSSTRRNTHLHPWQCDHVWMKCTSLTYSFCPCTHSQQPGCTNFPPPCLTGATKLLWALPLPAQQQMQAESSHLLNFRSQITFWSKIHERKTNNNNKKKLNQTKTKSFCSLISYFPEQTRPTHRGSKAEGNVQTKEVQT